MDECNRLRDELRLAQAQATHERDYGLLEGHVQSIREHQEVQALRDRIKRGEQQVAHVFQRCNDMATVDRSELRSVGAQLEACKSEYAALFE